MGHQRLDKLSNHRHLPDSFRYLVTGGAPTAPLVEQVTVLSRGALKHALRDPVFAEALWLLITLLQADASKDFPVAQAYMNMGAQRQASMAKRIVAFDEGLDRRRKGGAISLRQDGSSANKILHFSFRHVSYQPNPELH